MVGVITCIWTLWLKRKIKLQLHFTNQISLRLQHKRFGKTEQKLRFTNITSQKSKPIISVMVKDSLIEVPSGHQCRAPVHDSNSRLLGSPIAPSSSIPSKHVIASKFSLLRHICIILALLFFCMSTITSDVNYSLANIIETHLPIWWIHYSFFYFFSPYYVNLI
jgi:hypothetical protein